MSLNPNDMPARMVEWAMCLLPPGLREWGRAAVQEVHLMNSRTEAWVFALGCLGWALRAAVNHQFSRMPLIADLVRSFATMNALTTIMERPRALGVICAIAATAAGVTYLAIAGAPTAYGLVNLGALAFGFIVLATLSTAEARDHLRPGGLNLVLGFIVLAVALVGVSADGVTRWFVVGGLSLQPGLMVVPLMAVLFARSRDTLSTLGLVVAAAGLALQPDRGTAGAFAAGLMVLALLKPDRNSVMAALAALIAFAVTVARADPSPAVPFVDRILHTAASVHPLAGLAVLLGSLLLVVPALAARRGPTVDPSLNAVFGAVWAGLILAAALGNYPTPVVGYSGSAIIGYVISLMAFPSRLVAVMPTGSRAAVDGDERQPGHLATAH